MAKELVQIPAILKGMTRRGDRSWKLIFETRDLDGGEFSVLSDNYEGEGWLVYSPNEITMEDIPAPMAEAGQKSQSQRLRAVIFLWWKQRGEHGDFETFYRGALENLIDYVKAKLEPEEV